MRSPSIRDSEIVYKGFFDLRKDLLERADGLLGDYTSVILPPHAVVILAEDTEGLLILNREYRHPTGHFILGCPGGCLEEGEDPIQGGQRELLEETGYWSDDISILGSCYSLPSLSDQTTFFLYAKQATRKGDLSPDPFEFIETELKTKEQLYREIQEGVLFDGNLCAVLFYKSLLESIKTAEPKENPPLTFELPQS